ncbi:MAG: ATP-binding protein [Bellilinea sp.]
MIAPAKDKNILVIISNPQVNYLLERVLQSAGYTVSKYSTFRDANKHLEKGNSNLIIIGETVENQSGLEEAAKIIERYPAIPVLLFAEQDNTGLIREALHLGLSDYLCSPLKADEILRAVQNSLEKAARAKEWVLLESRRATGVLHQRVDELESLARLGQSITAELEIDSVLTAIVEAAVELTGAEEGSLLLHDPATDQLYMRASKNFQEDFIRTFRLPVQDTLAGSVLQSGQPVVIDETSPKKIKTSYLVHSLIYVPLLLNEKAIGVLGVDNRKNRLPFLAHDVQLLSTLAEYAVIALQNSYLFASSQAERNKLGTVLRRIQDGVVVIDNTKNVLILNQAAESSLGVNAVDVIGKPIEDIIPQAEVLALMNTHTGSLSNRTEYTAADGRVFSAQYSRIPEVGAALTFHDITYLRKLDRMKNEFVGTVSHDLRSPLTAILGYAELVERAGPVNELQAEFIRRVQSSVVNISHLVDDLVNLGRIQTGLDSGIEVFDLKKALETAIEPLLPTLTIRENQLLLNLSDELPQFYGNAVQIRRMFNNIIDNCIKFSKPRGIIQVNGQLEQDQIILQFIDAGLGISQKDLPYVFDKFFRGSNITGEMSGTGLGLAIVKSVVEAHSGRVWIESNSGQGTTLTVVLPLMEPPPAE